MTQAELEKGVQEILIDETALQARIDQLGVEISADYAGRDLLLVGVLKGAVFFMADLMRELSVPCEIDFMAISSYGADDLGRRPHPPGPRHQRRRAGRPRRRGHHRLGPHALVPDAKPERAKPAARDVTLLTKPERREIDVPCATSVRDPEPLRHRLRPRLRGALPQPSVRRGSASGSRAERHVAGQPTRNGGATPPGPGAEEGGCYPATTDVNRFFRSALFRSSSSSSSSSWRAGRFCLGAAAAQGDLLGGDRRGQERERQRVLFTPNRQQLNLTLVNGDKIKVNYPPQSATQFQNLLQKENVKFDSKEHGSSAWWALLINVLPFVILIAFWIFLMNQVQGGGSKVMSFGKSRAKRMSPDSPKVTFKDVAGADEAVEELHEIKEFLENPKKFQALGARIPKGVLLYGPPGTGKTLLARAVAGEAGVPFFSISASDFVEMFVGVGASRPRPLRAGEAGLALHHLHGRDRCRGPSPRRGSRGGHDEREQTLNQLLVEMDGFEMKDNIILIAATNRPDILDPALLRPGRFDRQIVVDRGPARPEEDPRGALARQAARARSTSLAAGTPGFTGADLNLINEAALLAARRGKKMIQQEELEEGIMRVIAGPGEEGCACSPRRSARSPPTTRWGTRSSATTSRTRTRSTRSRSSPAARRSGSRSRSRPRIAT